MPFSSRSSQKKKNFLACLSPNENETDVSHYAPTSKDRGVCACAKAPFPRSARATTRELYSTLASPWRSAPSPKGMQVTRPATKPAGRKFRNFFFLIPLPKKTPPRLGLKKGNETVLNQRDGLSEREFELNVGYVGESPVLPQDPVP
jgi:hypothetical protein